ncbi:hypothetical protein HJG60_009942 [Phyllostomus discolor]|uniref:Uncharacterized protein n=1 Tax=Phyllostomus discolor TaxID=89673 RepID=A0A834BCZ8_9CHIR|nr:hypothetical protein HJG60_009942 [Phyllostomus discolor]
MGTRISGGNLNQLISISIYLSIYLSPFPPPSPPEMPELGVSGSSLPACVSYFPAVGWSSGFLYSLNGHLLRLQRAELTCMLGVVMAVGGLGGFREMPHPQPFIHPQWGWSPRGCISGSGEPFRRVCGRFQEER